MTLLSPMMSKTQLAAELGVGEATIAAYRKMLKNPLPEPMKLGGKLYWPRDAVEAWLKNFLPRKSNGGT